MNRGSKKSRKPIFLHNLEPFSNTLASSINTPHVLVDEMGTKSLPAVALPGKMLQGFSSAVEVGKQ